MGCHALLQGIFPTQGLNPRLLHWQVDSLLAEPPGKPSLHYKFNEVINQQENEVRVVHLCTGMLPNPESKGNNASDNSVDGLSEYHTK